MTMYNGAPCLGFCAGGKELKRWDFFDRLPFSRQWEGWRGFKPLMKVVWGWWLEGAPLMKVVRRGNDRLWKRGLPLANKGVRRCSATPSVVDQYILQGGDLGKSNRWQAEGKSQILDLNHIMYFGFESYLCTHNGIVLHLVIWYILAKNYENACCICQGFSFCFAKSTMMNIWMIRKMRRI